MMAEPGGGSRASAKHGCVDIRFRLWFGLCVGVMSAVVELPLEIKRRRLYAMSKEKVA